MADPGGKDESIRPSIFEDDESWRATSMRRPGFVLHRVHHDIAGQTRWERKRVPKGALTQLILQVPGCSRYDELVEAPS